MFIKRPMKAVEVPNEDALVHLRYPVMVSPKLDGIRALFIPEIGFVTQSLKPVPNDHIRTTIQDYSIHAHYLDGELITVNANGVMDEYNDIQSKIMTKSGFPLFEYHVFDYFEQPRNAYPHRFQDLHEQFKLYPLCNQDIIKIVPHPMAHSPEQVLEMYDTSRANGFEGVMIRSMDGPYKEGRATWKQQWLLKWKGDRSDAEGVVVDFEELMINENPQTTNLLGRNVRSHHKDNMIPGNTLGKLILMTKEWGEVRVGGGLGMTAELRKKIWDNREEYRNAIVTFLYQKHGMKDKPRFPQFKGFRYD